MQKKCQGCATTCLGVYLEFPFLQVGFISLWALVPLADRLSVRVAAVPGRRVRRPGSPSLLLCPLIPMWLWPADVDCHIFKMITVSVKMDLFYFLCREVSTWVEEISVRDTDIWKKVFFLQLWSPPSRSSYWISHHFSVLLKYQTVGVSALNVFSMCKQLWT